MIMIALVATQTKRLTPPPNTCVPTLLLIKSKPECFIHKFDERAHML